MVGLIHLLGGVEPHWEQEFWELSDSLASPDVWKRGPGLYGSERVQSVALIGLNWY